MKKGIVVALVGVFSVFAVGTTVIAAEGPDGKMTINLPAASFDKPKGKTKAPQVGVTFNHKKHGADLKCVTCHHTAADARHRCGREGLSCFWTPRSATARLPTASSSTAKDMIHKGACVKCHKDADAKDAASKAPTKCNECHGGARVGISRTCNAPEGPATARRGGAAKS